MRSAGPACVPTIATSTRGATCARSTRGSRALLEHTPAEGRVVFAGSSMGAFVSGFASIERACDGLFLLALPVAIPGYRASRSPRHRCRLTLVHGWHDEVCPVDATIEFARERGATLHLVDDDHRLGAHVDFCADVFRRFLAELGLTCPVCLRPARKGSNCCSATNCARSAPQDAHEALAGVHFSGTLELAYRACLWSRLASRILLHIAEFDAADADALYAGSAVDRLVRRTSPTTARSRSTRCQQRERAASHAVHRVAQQGRDSSTSSASAPATRPNVDVERPSIRINVRLHKDRATVSLDLSGTPLHRRGWRQGQGDAPLKENLACAMLLRAGWPAVFAAGGALVDPMCGAGTLLIEGALMAADVAPGLQREYFGFLGWREHDAAVWDGVLGEARARADTGLRALQPVFFGYDHDPHVLNEAKRNAQAAGVAGFVHLARQSVEHLKRPGGDDAAPGLVICNPPYGERLGERAQLGALYRALGERLRTEFADWRAAIIVSDDELGHALGLRADKRYVLYNGALECKLVDVRSRRRERAARTRRAAVVGRRPGGREPHRQDRSGICANASRAKALPATASTMRIFPNTRPRSTCTR